MTLDELLDGIDQLTDETRDNGLSGIAAERLRAVRDYCHRVVNNREPGEHAAGKEMAGWTVLDLLDGE